MGGCSPAGLISTGAAATIRSGGSAGCGRTPSQNITIHPVKSNATVAIHTVAINKGGTNKKKAPTPPKNNALEEARRMRSIADFTKSRRHANRARG